MSRDTGGPRIRHRPLRVALEATYWKQQGGTGRYLSSIAGELNRRNDVDLLIFRAPRLTGRMKRPLRTALNGLLHLIWVQVIMPIWARWRHVDLIHASMVGPAFAPCPVVITLHDALDFHRRYRTSTLWSAYVRAAGIRAAGRAARIICVSAAARDEIIEHTGISTNRTVVVPNGSDIAGIEPRQPTWTRDIDDPIILAVGPHIARKNLSTLVDACEAARATHPLHLVLIGERTQGFVQGRPWITAAVGCTNAELAWLYRQAAAVAVPSRYEGFGLPALEALSVGTPVICADIPALREVAEDCGVFVQATDVDSFATAIRDVIDDPVATRQKVGVCAGRTWSHVADDLLSIYREITGYGSP
ncbi:MAG: glycosyltransferase family 4 protein [Chloroflexota bacterium]